jgi:methyl-accepting chemotaxis protein
MSIARRASLCFTAITLLLVLLGAFSYLQLNQLRGSEQHLEKSLLPSIQAGDDLQIALLHARLESIRLLATNDSQGRDAVRAKLNDSKNKLVEASSRYRRYFAAGADGIAQFDQAASAMKRYMDGLDKLVALGLTDHATAVQFANTEQAENARAYQETLSALRNADNQAAVQEGVAAQIVYDNSVSVVSAVVGGALLLTILLAIVLTRSVTLPMQVSVTVAQSIAAGDLTKLIDDSGVDEAAQLMQALKLMQANLRITIQDIADSSLELTQAASSMNTVTESASRNLLLQNDEINQAATAVNQMTAAVEEVARNAISTSEAARQSNEAATVGNTRVSDTLTAMRNLTDRVESSAGQVQRLAEQTKDISKVVGVIRSIAEQTNLLALNAAIEAARAGEQGRGFAVVADEVRALAHRTQASTLEVEEMIISIQADTTSAVTSILASTSQAHSTQSAAIDAGKSLETITSAVVVINDRNLQIASACEQQADVAREVDRSLSSIRQLASASSEGAQRTLQASRALSTMAAKLNGLVQRFVVG